MAQVIRLYGWLHYKVDEKSDLKSPMSQYMIKQVMKDIGYMNIEVIDGLQYKHQYKYQTLLGEIIFYYILC